MLDRCLAAKPEQEVVVARRAPLYIIINIIPFFGSVSICLYLIEAKKHTELVDKSGYDAERDKADLAW